MKPYRILLSLMLLGTFLLTACSPAAQAVASTATSSPQNDQSVINTSVAATVSGLSTELASLKQTNAAPSATPGGTGTPNAPGTPVVGLLPQATPAAHTAGLCDYAAFISDINIPDGTMIPPGTKFTKTWAIKNTGSCAWTPEYSLVYVGGDLLGAPSSLPMTTANVAPGETTRVSIEFTAPNDLTIHRSFWKFRNASGGTFGVTDAQGKEQPIWTEIRTGEVYSFIENMCLATWHAGTDTVLPCPGDPNATTGGAVYTTSGSRWEDGNIENEPVLAMVPPSGTGGTITGQFPPVVVPQWSNFITRFGCMAENKQCNAHVKITYSIEGGPEQVLVEDTQTYDQNSTKVHINLIKYMVYNKPVSFIFYVTSNGEGDQNMIYFLVPRLTP
jgi:hypothetical protein